MQRVTRFLAGFILGSLLGAAAALLLAPYSGEGLRGQVRSEAERIQLEVRRAAETRRAELEEQLAVLRAPRSAGGK